MPQDRKSSRNAGCIERLHGFQLGSEYHDGQGFLTNSTVEELPPYEGFQAGGLLPGPAKRHSSEAA